MGKRAQRGLPLKPFVFAAALLPLVWLAWRGGEGSLGINPIETVIRFLGDWALRFLLIALAVTPLRKVSGWAGVARLRRMLGLFAFFYACLHVAAYVGVDQFFDWHAIGKDIVKRRFITVGMATMLILLPLAVTSTNAMVKRLGGRRWRALHRLVYAAGGLAVLHYFMMVKADVRMPMLHAALLAILLGYRGAAAWMERRRRPVAAALRG
ncbi:MAG: sulfite oxidase heme-binding subunit YedZ [Solirubrobacterales bacterium]